MNNDEPETGLSFERVVFFSECADRAGRVHFHTGTGARPGSGDEAEVIDRRHHSHGIRLNYER